MIKITAFAPATVANVAVGFDILGFPIEEVGDRVTVERVNRNKEDPVGVTIDKVLDPEGRKMDLPLDPHLNTATVGLLKMIKELKLSHGFKVIIEKGISIGSGMGGSAASSVAAVVAANALLDQPLPMPALLDFALAGEEVASGAAHPDNIVPCLFGGLRLIRAQDPIKIIEIPVPDQILCVVVHPHLVLETKEARRILKKTVPMDRFIQQSANLATFISGCFKADRDLIQASLRDLVIEPQRAPLVRGFEQVKAAALSCGALGCSLSGSGPSLFAWVEGKEAAEKARAAMASAFEKFGIASDSWISRISSQGARVIL